ncbi:MAG: Gfo/Idh/MocA family oxidoreductase [Terracidiphilus sp.]
MIRVGVVGFGLGGRVFHAPLISSVDGLELAAVVERTSDQAAERYPGITTYRTLDQLLADASINLVVVTTPSGTHYEIALQALEAGKNVVVDKPVAVGSAKIAELLELAAGCGLQFVPFHNRRWDSDFLTIQNLLHQKSLGRLVHMHSCFDRWSPGATRRLWKDDPAEGGGTLLDLGTHVADQALALFGKPETLGAEVRRERDGEGANDSFTLRLHYYNLLVTLEANLLSTLARPRFHLRGTKGNYWKWGVDPQEAALSKVTRITDPHWGEEPPAAWGTLSVDVDGGMVTCPVTPVPGDYRLFYAGVRDALLGKGPAPVEAVAAWRVARLLEWAVESSEQRCNVDCNWSGEPG